MLYPSPKKIQLAPSQAKWRIEAEKSVLVFLGLDQLKAQYSGQKNVTEQELFQQLTRLFKKAKALDIPIVDLNMEHLSDGMMRLGEHASQGAQLMVAGEMNAAFRQIIQHMASVSEQMAIINDAIVLDDQNQHIQCIQNWVALGLHHLNTSTLTRLWSLSAATEFVRSAKGILLALAEQLDIEPLEIDPTANLKDYGLDSIGIVELIGLWRANGAEIRYEDFVGHVSLQKILSLVEI